MDEQQNQTASTNTEETVAQSNVATDSGRSSVMKHVLLAVVAIVILGLVIFFVNNRQAPVDSNGISPAQVIATVDGVEIVGADLSTSISQITTTAQLQGIDTTDPSVQSEIRAQAVEMLVNTEILEQEAEERGITITDEDVDNRIEILVQEIGSQEALDERMLALGIDQETLERDVKSELMIQSLLDEVFVEATVAVTEEDIVSVYETTTSGEETDPTLEEVRPQIEAQLQAQQEQRIIDAFITELRAGAVVDIVE